jgi:16S rRNA (cytosine967-C5)-methyltransferase
MIRRHVTEKRIEKRRQKITPLRLGAFQLMPDSKVPPSAAIDETVKLTRATVGEGLTGFVNAVLRNIAKDTTKWNELIPRGESIEDLSIRYAQPEWLVELLTCDYVTEAVKGFLEGLTHRLDTTVRLNRLRTPHEQFEESLRNNDIPIERSSINSEYYTLPSSLDLSQFRPLVTGECFVQNISSGIVIDLLLASSDDRVLDLCAAPGGKTAAIAIKTGKPERITAIDIDTDRVEKLRGNLTRLGLDAVNVERADGRSHSGSEYDSVLVDAPCSGLGTLSKHPEIKYIQSAENIRKLSTTQSELLENAARLIKPGGILVYSVCTLSNSETKEIMSRFLESHSDFILDVPGDFGYHQFVRDDNALFIPPGSGNLEGMFAFRVRKAN